MADTKPSRVPNKLIIIESINKAPRIQAILGNEWRVLAAAGTFNVDPILPPLIVRNELTDKHAQCFAAMQAKIDQHTFETVVLATDPDYQGSIIAQRLLDNLKFPVQPQLACILGYTKNLVNEAINNLVPIVDNKVKLPTPFGNGNIEKVLVIGIELNMPQAEIQDKLGSRWQVFNIESFNCHAGLANHLEKLQAIINEGKHDRIIFVAKACYRNYDLCTKLYSKLNLATGIQCGWFFECESLDEIVNAVSFAYHLNRVIGSEEALSKHIEKIKKETEKK